MGSRLTLNYGLRYERINPITEAQNRLTGFMPGVQSVVFPSAPMGLVFPGDPGIPDGIAQSANGVMPRLGVRVGSDRRRRVVGARQLRPVLRPVRERRRDGVAGAGQLHPVGAVQPVQRPGPQLPEPVPGTRLSRAEHVRASVHRVHDRHGGEAALHAGLERRRAALAVRQVPARGPLRGGEGRAHLPRNIEAQPGGVRPGRHGAERRPAARLRQLPGGRRHLRLLDHRDAVATSRTRTTKPARSASRGAIRPASDSTSPTGCRARRTSCRR